MLGKVLEVVEGGMWKGEYRELEEVVGKLLVEGKRKWMEKRSEKGRGGGREWKELGRLALEVGWAIEERKGMTEEGRGGINQQGLKKEVEEEKQGREKKLNERREN